MVVSFGLTFWWAVIAIAAGTLAGALFIALHATQGPRLGVPQTIQSRGQFGFYGAVIPLVVVVAVTGGLIVGLMAKWAPIIQGHGIPEAMEAVLTKQSRISPRTALAKPLSAAIAIGTGGPKGSS